MAVYKPLISFLNLCAFLACCQQPMNITRYVNETYVYIPCPFEPSVWRINGRDYISATFPSLYVWTSSGLFIEKIYKCLDQTSFQCIDTSKNGLTIRESNIGTLTVVSTSSKVNSESCLSSHSLDVPPSAYVELDHQVTRFEMHNFTLGWKIVPQQSACNMSQILSYSPCQQNNIVINITTFDTKVTLSSGKLYISNQLADFNISTFSYQSAEECPELTDSVRINVTKLETINLLLGNNNCTCVNLQCHGGLHVVISNPDPNQEDVLCPVYATGSTCYNPSLCGQFIDTPFFRICGAPSDGSGCTYSMCFQNITEQLNGTKLDFFTLTRALCQSTPIYLARTYIRSFEIKVSNASADISFNSTSGEACFTSSSRDCSLTLLTQYNVSIVDITGNSIFNDESIPEYGCAIIKDLLPPNCEPYIIMAQPYNDYITYSPVSLEISSESDSSDDLICSCVLQTVQLAMNISEGLLEYYCSTLYTPPLDTVIVINTTTANHQFYATCSNRRDSIMIGQTYICSDVISICGYLTTGLHNIDCLLNCSSIPPCPTTPTEPSRDILISSVIAMTVGMICITSTMIIIIVLTVMIRYRQIKCSRRQEYENIEIEKNPAYEDVNLKSSRRTQVGDNSTVL